MKKYQKHLELDQSREQINFSSIQNRVFREENGQIYIGNEKITQEMRDLLREQAKYLKTSQIIDLLDATIINESSNLALIQSTNFAHVEFAKALYHWNIVFKNMILILSK